MVVKYVKAVDRSLFRALVRDSALGGLSVVISRGFMLLLNLIVARSFTDPAEFGIFSTVCMTVNLVAIFTGSGIMLAAIREVAAAGNVERQNQTIRTVFSLISLASIVAAVVLLVGRVDFGLSQGTGFSRHVAFRRLARNGAAINRRRGRNFAGCKSISLASDCGRRGHARSACRSPGRWSKAWE